MSVQERRKYDSVFKRNVVKLTEGQGRTVTEIAGNLGIGKDLLYRWWRERSTVGYKPPLQYELEWWVNRKQLNSWAIILWQNHSYS